MYINHTQKSVHIFPRSVAIGPHAVTAEQHNLVEGLAAQSTYLWQKVSVTPLSLQCKQDFGFADLTKFGQIKHQVP